MVRCMVDATVNNFLRFGDLWSVQSALHAEWNSDR